MCHKIPILKFCISVCPPCDPHDCTLRALHHYRGTSPCDQPCSESSPRTKCLPGQHCPVRSPMDPRRQLPSLPRLHLHCRHRLCFYSTTWKRYPSLICWGEVSFNNVGENIVMENFLVLQGNQQQKASLPFTLLVSRACYIYCQRKLFFPFSPRLYKKKGIIIMHKCQ